MTTQFTLPTEADEIAELHALGVGVVVDGDKHALTADVKDAAEADAVASHLLRKLAEAQADRARTAKAFEIERDQLLQRYSRLFEPHTSRIAFLESMLANLASTVEFGKKKSRDVGYGTYGRRQVRAHLEIVDDAKALAWAIEKAPSAVKALVALDIARARALGVDAGAKLSLLKTPLSDYFATTGEEPDGCQWVPARDEPFFKVATPDAVDGALPGAPATEGGAV